MIKRVIRLNKLAAIAACLAGLFVLSAHAFADEPGISTGDMTALSNARETYHTNCAMCHGFDGVPIMPGVPNFAKGERLDSNNAELIKTIREGKNAMPPWKEVLSEQEQSQVLGYTRLITGDDVFQNHCSSCHETTMPPLTGAIPKDIDELRKRAHELDFCSGGDSEKVMTEDDIVTLIEFIRNIPQLTDTGSK